MINDEEINQIYDANRIKIGQGMYSEVYKTRHIESGTIVAMKIINKQLQNSQQLQNELEILKSVAHSNIVKLYDAWADDNMAYLFLEYCDGGSLRKKIWNGGFYKNAAAAKIIRTVVDAVAYLHQHSIVHRDIKPDNILFLDKSPESKVMLGDFGLAKFMNESTTTSYVGTLGYLAPEIIQRKSYNYKCDIWSIGIVAYELITGKLPFKRNLNENGLLALMQQEDINYKYDCGSPLARDFVKQCLRFDPNSRPDAAYLLCHPWLRGEEDCNCMNDKDGQE